MLGNRMRAAWLPVGILGLTMLFFLGEAMMVDGQPVTVIELVLFHADMVSRCAWSDVFACGLWCDWFYLLLPVLEGLPTVLYLCDEHETAFHRYIISRVGSKRYFHQSVFTVVLVSIALVCSSVLIFGIISRLVFPWKVDYGEAEIIGEAVSQFQVIYGLVRDLLYLLFYSVFLAVLLYFVSCISNSPYVVLTLVFLVNDVIYEGMLNHVFLVPFFSVALYSLAWLLFGKRWRF